MIGSHAEPLAATNRSIRRFIMLWTGAVLLAFLLLSSGLVYAVARQHSKMERIFFDAGSLQTNHLFETTILAEGRQDLLWHVNGEEKYAQAKAIYLREADRLLAEMKTQADSPVEVKLADTVASDYQAFRAQVQLPLSHKSTATQQALDKLIDSIHRHRELNSQQMNDSMQSSNRIDFLVNVLSAGVILAAAALMVAGGIELWSRIFKPTLALAHAAEEFGKGNLEARAPVLREDEMGTLSGTFNTMAQAVCDRERDRLDFVATVAHDLKNPLVVIGGAAHLMQAKEFRLTPEEKIEWLKTIVAQTKNLEAMIGDLTDGVQAETGRIHVHCEPLDFASLVQHVVQTHSQTVKTHLIRYDGVEECPLHGDRKRLERVVMNLISNAVKYSPQGHEVSVQLQRNNGMAKLSVQDEGVGIAPEDIPKLFLPFARLDRTRKMAKGTGLGLSSVKKIIEAHDGTINMKSQLNVGTTVEVKLPCSTAAQPQKN